MTSFRRLSHLLYFPAILFAAATLPSCSDKKDSLEEEIRKVASTPTLQNEQGLDMIAYVISENPEAYGSYLREDGSIDMERLSNTIGRIGKRSDPSFNWDINAYGGVPNGDLRLHLFLERSGSMTGYDARSTGGDFKRTLNELITRFPRVDGNPGSISIVNDNVYPYGRSFEEFVQEKDIFASTAGLGNPAYTDFAIILEHVLCDTVPENINVLVTDLIYSPKDTEGVTPQKIFNEERGLATSIFQKHAEKSVIVVKLSGDFDGYYYPYSDPRGGMRYTGERPYYAVITGSAMAMHKLLNDKKYASFTDFASLPGYQADYIFSRHPLPLAYYTLIPRGKTTKGKYTIGSSGDGETGFPKLKDAKGDENNRVSFRIAADLRNIPATEKYLLNPDNYLIKGSAESRIVSIEPITESMIDPRNRRFLEPATHLLTVETDARRLSPQLEISLLNSMPEWFSQSATSDDTNPLTPSFSTTTFGVDKLLEGIYRAYHSASSTPLLFTMRFAVH